MDHMGGRTSHHGHDPRSCRRPVRVQGSVHSQWRADATRRARRGMVGGAEVTGYSYHERGLPIAWLCDMERQIGKMTSIEAKISKVLFDRDLPLDEQVTAIAGIVADLMEQSAADERARLCRVIKHDHDNAELADALWAAPKG